LVAYDRQVLFSLSPLYVLEGLLGHNPPCGRFFLDDDETH
jgi:hypothetical protein